MFAYCLNNPINMCDQQGASAIPISYVAFGDTLNIIVFAKKGQKDWVPKTNRPKDSDKRHPTGERERNKKHPNGEEHSRNPKGSGRHIHHCEYSLIPQYVYFEDYQIDIFDKGTGAICYTSQLSTINYLAFDLSNDFPVVTFVPLLAIATTIVACMFTEDFSHRTG
jgi:hypothetical protein